MARDIGKTKLSEEEKVSRQRRYCRKHYKKYLKKVHGEKYYQIKYRVGYVPSPQAFNNLPKRMTREEAFAYYSKKLNKFWEKIYG